MSTRVITLPLSISNAYLVLGDRPVLVDAGSPGDQDRLVDRLWEHGVAPHDLALIAFTHGHTDHTGAVAAVAGHDTPVAIGAADAALLENGANAKLPPTGPAGRLMGPLVQRMTFAGWRPHILVHQPLRLDAYGIGAVMVPVGGHTAGSCAVLLDDGDAIAGDLIRGGFASGRIRPGYPLRHYFTEDPHATRQAVERILAHEPDAFLVGHGGPLAADDVRHRLDKIA